MEYIESNDGLKQAAAECVSAGLFAADTEAAGYHRYRDTVSLVQLSTRTRTWVVDPLALKGLDPLRAPLLETAVEVVFHDADYDLRLLHRDYGFEVRGLFDTKIAAEFLGEPGLGLASLLERHLDVTIPKKYQRADWARRPLPQDMIEYAAEDTRYLPDLRDVLRDELVKAGRLAWAEEEFRLRERTLWENGSGDGDEDAWRLKGARDLDRRSLGVLREVHAWRESVAAERDQATFRVLGNDALLGIASAQPRSTDELAAIKGVGDGNARRHGKALMAAVKRALDLPEAELPERPKRGPRRPYDPELDERVDRLKAVRDEFADQLSLDRGFLMPRHQLETIARAQPASTAELAEVEGVRRWQVEVMGERVVAAL